MGALYKYKKDGYVFEDPLGSIIPWPIAKIDEFGDEIPLTMDEINSWRDNYIKEHPEVTIRIIRVERKQKTSFLKRIIAYLKR